MKSYLTRHYGYLSAYHLAILLSIFSFIFGILREFLIVGMLGFSLVNDHLQSYMSIFYTIGLSIDAMRLTCLNLYTILPLRLIILFSSIVILPFTIAIAGIMDYAIGGLDRTILLITIIGSYLNLVVAILIAYSQRSDLFLKSQLINVMPNFILIPGIIICYFYSKNNIIISIVTLTAIIPLIQCIFLLLIQKKNKVHPIDHPRFLTSMKTILRHMTAMTGEQLFQIIARSVFYNYGTGYLSLYALAIRLYSAVRSILIDNFIGSKLSNWHNEKISMNSYLIKMIKSTVFVIIVAMIAFLISLRTTTNLIDLSIQMTAILTIGFCLSTLVRIIYFKINHYENNSQLVTQFASYELCTALIAYLITIYADYPLLSILWLGYIAKPLTQFFLLRKRFYSLSVSQEC